MIHPQTKVSGFLTYKVLLKNRQILYQIISEKPGIHLREIFRKTKISEGTIKYHLNYLQRKELVTSKSENGYKRFYIAKKHMKEDIELWNIFRDEIDREIILYFMISQAISRIKLIKDLKRSPKIIEYHLKRLIDKDIVELGEIKNNYVDLKKDDKPRYKEYKRTSNEKVYIIKNKDKIESFILRYKQNFSDDKNPLDCVEWIGLLREEMKFPDKISDSDERFEKLIELINEILPIPFCS